MRDRHSSTTRQFDSQQLALLTKPADATIPVDELDEFGEWDDSVAVAAGSVPRDSTPLVSRTATVDDPMTTGLLAETSRVTQTADLSPEQIEQAHRAAVEPGVEPGVEPTIELPAKPAPASPRLIIRRPTRVSR